MATLAELAPEFVSAVKRAFEEEEEGHSDLANAIGTLEIAKVTFDPEARMGYITFVRLKDYGYSETFPFAAPYWFNIDVDDDGVAIGIEVDGSKEELLAIIARTL